MKILFIADGITPFTIGGMQRHSANLVKSLLKVGQSVSLGFTVNSDEAVPGKEEVLKALEVDNSTRANIDFKVFKFDKTKKIPGHYIRNSKKMSSRIYKEYSHEVEKFDVIYCKGLLGWEFVQQRKLGNIETPVLVNLHGYEMFQEAPNLKIKVQHLLLLRGVTKEIINNADWVISYGAKITSLLKSVGVDKIIELQSGVTDDWIVPEVKMIKRDKIRLVFLGRFERRKGIQEIHEAIRANNDEFKSRLEFHFIGPIPSEEHVDGENVTYHGSKRDVGEIRALLDQMDVLLCPSYSEGMPNVILEGMSRGLGIVASDVGAVSLMVGSDNGVLLDRVSAEKLAEALIGLNVDCVNEMKKNSLIKIQGFRWGEIAKKSVQKIEEVLG